MLAKYKYFSNGLIREMLVNVEPVDDYYMSVDKYTYDKHIYSAADLEFISYDPFTQYNDMIFNTHRDFIKYIVSCITDNSVDDITDEINENVYNNDDIQLYNWLMSDMINNFIESWLYQHESEDYND